MNIGLSDLDLSWNCIRQKGGVAIAKALTVSFQTFNNSVKSAEAQCLELIQQKMLKLNVWS